MLSLRFVFNVDADGDGTALLQIVNEADEPIRYLTVNELRKVLRDDHLEGEGLPEYCGICMTCGASCDDDGICPACDEDEGDELCDYCGKSGIEICRTDADGCTVCVACDDEEN